MLKSNKMKFYALVIGVLLFIPVMWSLALRKTVDARTQVKELQLKLENVQNAPERIAVVEKRIKYLNQLLVNDANGEAFQNRVLDEISTICKQKGLLLKEMPPMFRNIDNNYMVETINIHVAGSFHDLVLLVYLLEHPKKNLSIISTNYFIEENKRLKQKQLVLSLYIQTLKENEDEAIN